MPIPPEDRPLETLREEAIDRLIVNYGHGRLSLAAFQRRLDQAHEAQDHEALAALTADLDLDVDASYLQSKAEKLGPRVEPDAGEDAAQIVSILSGNERKGEWRVPGELRVLTLLGGTELDFTQARFTSATTRLKVFCMLGGIEIKLPEGINTTVNAGCILGGIEDKSPAGAGPDAPRLVIEGFVLAGGVEIKVPKKARERLAQFAEGLRAMFQR